jgi:hypothetical protein
MAIITKPNNISKGTEVTFTLFKTNLINNSAVSSDDYFSSFSNWNRVYLNYVSTEGNQVKIVTFTEEDGFFEGTFTSSEKVRNSFMIQSITIVDFDGQLLEVDRNFLNSEEFDFTFANSDSEEFVFLLEDGYKLLLDSDDFLEY